MPRSLIAGASASLHARQIRLQEAERDRLVRAYHRATVALLLQLTPHERETLIDIKGSKHHGLPLTTAQADIAERIDRLDAAQAGPSGTTHDLFEACLLVMSEDDFTRRVNHLCAEYRRQN